MSDEVEILKNQTVTLEKSFEEASKEKQKLNDVTASLDRLKKQWNVLETLNILAATVASLREQQTDTQSKIAQFADDLKEATRLRTESEIIWHSSQAAILAATLEEGSACPVCGSTEHPQLAISTQRTVTLQQVNELRANESTISDNVNQQQQELAKLTSTLESTESQRNDLLGSLEIEEQQLRPFTISIQNDINMAEATIHQLNQIDLKSMDMHLVQHVNEVSTKQEALNHLTTSVNESAISKEQLRAVVTQLETDNHTGYANTNEVVQRQTVISSELKQLSDALEVAQSNANQTGETLVKYQSHLDTLTKQLNDLNKDHHLVLGHWQTALASSSFCDEANFLTAILAEPRLSELELELATFARDEVRVSEQLKLVNEELSDTQLPDISLLLHTKNETDTLYQRKLGECQQEQSKLDSLNQVLTRVNSLMSQNRELEKQYQVVGTLSDVANGKTGNKISLHRFVLGVLLDDVLIQASQRLRLMSKGRYDLKRKETRSKGNAGSGLDLIVEDAYTGKWRDVATLSGGESFMAALSLALGLSDVVQSYSGGIRLDTLFIDEGFGSLDPESLDLAIQTLVELQQSGRTIGIISHVSELKEQMPLRLDVHASRIGSTVRLVN